MNNNNNNKNNNNNNNHNHNTRRHGTWGDDGARLTVTFRAIRDLRPFEHRDENNGRRDAGSLWQQVRARINNVHPNVPPLSLSTIKEKKMEYRDNWAAEDRQQRRGTGTNETYSELQNTIDEVIQLQDIRKCQSATKTTRAAASVCYVCI
ncbi:hypothetical protein BDA99DRAFT_570407 [Phascolomyces articulosus]|uniref:Uncharacterized protein n=1 Tax=Phascolomyces articulosus TaxID=60185 RepID=A0AAD5PI19_9FUNG|nr:hypothetical protein BDA99DRAFT_570407 [Phascolomyces articulosus]